MKWQFRREASMTDFYTKAVLTVIAAALVGLSIQNSCIRLAHWETAEMSIVILVM
jgi:hypothetical protein